MRPPLSSGNVQCWGGTWSGAPWSYTGGDAVSLGASGGSCILRSNHNVHCFGLGPTGTYGLGNAVQVAATMQHACALLDSGAIYCWGDGVPETTVPHASLA